MSDLQYAAPPKTPASITMEEIKNILLTGDEKPKAGNGWIMMDGVMHIHPLLFQRIKETCQQSEDSHVFWSITFSDIPCQPNPNIPYDPAALAGKGAA